MRGGLLVLIGIFLGLLVLAYRGGYISGRGAVVYLVLAIVPIAVSLRLHSGVGFLLSFFGLILLCVALMFQYGADSSWFKDPVGQRRKPKG
jgi:hypothetical protein